MGAKVRVRNGVHWVFVNHDKQRRAKRVAPGAAGKRLADQLAKKWNASLVLGDVEKVFPKAAPASVGALPTLREALPAWIEHREAVGDIRGATGPAYLSAAKTWIFPALGDIPADQITRAQLGAVVTAIKKAGKSRSTVGHALKILRSYYRDLVETKRLAESPAESLRYFVGRMKGRKDIALFSKAEMKAVKRAAKVTDPRLYPFLEMAFGTGGRWGELAVLTRDSVDLKARDGVAGWVTFSKSWSRNVRKLDVTKTDKVRAVPLSKKLVKILREWIEVRAAEGWGEKELLFPGPENRHMVTWGERWLRLLKHAGITQHRPFKATRNCFASYALLGGARPENVQRWLGHATLSMTLDTYRQFIPVHEADARDAARLGDLVGC